MNKALSICAGALFLVLPALFNGAPLFYFDTPAYFNGADRALAWLQSTLFSIAPVVAGEPSAAPDLGSNGVQSGRSPYYGVFAWLGWKTTFWLPVAVQALTLCWLLFSMVAALFATETERFRYTLFFVIVVILTVATPASAFVTLIMPDIWVALMAMACACLWLSPNAPERWEIFGFWAVMTFAAVSHTSHLLLLALLAGGALALFIVRRAPSLFRLGVLSAALVSALVGQWAFSAAVKSASGEAPLSRPHITAHLIDMGPGTRHALAACPDAGYVLCDHLENLPTDWIDFLFSTDPTKGVYALVPATEQRLFADEQMAFALGTLQAEPLATMGGLAYDGLAQLWTFSITDLAQSEKTKGFLQQNFPPDLVELVQRSRVYAASDWVAAWSSLIYLVTGVSICVIVVFLTGKNLRVLDQRLLTISAILLISVIINAMVCGVLASPYGRFQARIVWLVVLVTCFLMAGRLTAKTRVASGSG